MRLIAVILVACFFIIPARAAESGYGLYRPENYNYEKYGNTDEKILFIMDFSNSMTE